MKPDTIIRKSSSWAALFQRLIPMKLKEEGDVFERVVQLFLKTHPEYQFKLAQVWMLDEVPKRVRTKLNFPDTDEGIDLSLKPPARSTGPFRQSSVATQKAP